MNRKLVTILSLIAVLAFVGMVASSTMGGSSSVTHTMPDGTTMQNGDMQGTPGGR